MFQLINIVYIYIIETWEPKPNGLYKEVLKMFIYENLNNLDNQNEELGVSPLSYVALNCAR